MFSLPKNCGPCSAWRKKKRNHESLFFSSFIDGCTAVECTKPVHQVLRVHWLSQNALSLPSFFSSYVHVNFIFDIFIYIDIGLQTYSYILYDIECKTSGSLVVKGARNNSEVSGVPLCDRQQVPLNWLPSQAALGLPQQAVKIHGVILAFCGGWIKVVRMGVWKRQ